ncbi:WD40 repeat-like protein [Schizopora paradoxa]|uniref:WD40 repeat-like protein n=1 Tax=Schizopora paradoxa TaxID=27342 RepID=A0A0H2S891_9AGAM|nr:WD40 repeat-like protein [Schizopora paradoxa]
MAIPSTPHTLSVHRCRFVDYSPAAITAIAFPPLALPSAKTFKQKSRPNRFGTLAIGRADGNIEICEWSGTTNEAQAEQGWTLSKMLFGPIPSKVDSLVFSLRNPHLHSSNEVPKLSDLRLFSAGGGSELLEWDLMRGTILRSVSSQGGAIWSMSVNPSSTSLALGCEDGSVHLFSLEADSLDHHRKLDRMKCRILSVAWGPPVPPSNLKKKLQGGLNEEDEEDEGDWSDSWLVTGNSDSSIRKWDIATGRAVQRMSTDRTKGERTLVWAVGALADGTIVSGDSLGMVKFWDAKTCTQTFSFPAHGADVLCLAISPDGSSVFTSGVDQKVCQFSLVKNSGLNNNSRASTRWISSTAKRMHSHDVRALAIWPPYSSVSTGILTAAAARNGSIFAGISPILVSGGLDASPVLAPCASALSTTTSTKLTNALATSMMSTFEDAYHRRMPYTTGAMAPAIHLSRAQRLLCCVKESSVAFWKVLGQARSASQYDTAADRTGEQFSSDKEGFEKLLDMDLDMTTNICASAVSEDGRWLAVADVYDIKLFELREQEDGRLKPRRIKSLMSTLTQHLLQPSASEGASALGFSPDSTKLVIGTSLSGSVLVVDLGRTHIEDDNLPEIQVLQKFDHHRKTNAKFIKTGRIVRNIPSGSKPNGRSDVANNVSNGGSHADRAAEGEDEDDSGPSVDESAKGSESESESAYEDEDEDEQQSFSLVTRMAFSPDCQWMATTDDQCVTHIFNLDALQHHTTLPTSPLQVHALGFSPAPNLSSNPPIPETASTIQSTSFTSLTSILVMAHADNSISVYDVDARRYPEWARHLCERELLPKRFRALHDPVLGVVFNPPQSLPSLEPNDMDVDGAPSLTPVSSSENGERFAVFWGATWICRVELNAPVGWGGFSKKRTRDGKKNVQGQNVTDKTALAQERSKVAPGDLPADEEVSNFKIVTRYRPILFADFLNHDELLIVERPLVDVLAGLPPAFFKPKYGT